MRTTTMLVRMTSGISVRWVGRVRAVSDGSRHRCAGRECCWRRVYSGSAIGEPVIEYIPSPYQVCSSNRHASTVWALAARIAEASLRHGFAADRGSALQKEFGHVVGCKFAITPTRARTRPPYTEVVTEFQTTATQLFLNRTSQTSDMKPVREHWRK